MRVINTSNQGVRGIVTTDRRISGTTSKRRSLSLRHGCVPIVLSQEWWVWDAVGAGLVPFHRTHGAWIAGPLYKDRIRGIRHGLGTSEFADWDWVRKGPFGIGQLHWGRQRLESSRGSEHFLAAPEGVVDMVQCHRQGFRLTAGWAKEYSNETWP